MKEEGLFRVLTTGVLLGIAGAALFELAKAVLDLMLTGLPHFEAVGYAVLAYVVTFIVALMLAGLAIQASVSGFALYALPIAFLGVVMTFTLLLGATYLGAFGPTDAVDAQRVWRTLAVVGAALLVLGAVHSLRRDYGSLLRPVGRRFVPVGHWITTHTTWTLTGAGAVLIVLGLLFGR
jgi:hypothetical protein